MADPNDIVIDPQAYIEVLSAELARESQSRRFYQALALQYQKQIDECAGQGEESAPKEKGVKGVEDE